MSRVARTCLILLVAFALASLAACKREEKPMAQPEAKTEAPPQAAPTMMETPALPAPEGQAVIAYITKDNPYQKWQMWPGKEALYTGQHPHGAFLTTYVTPQAYDAIENKAGQIPADALIVKENYSPEKQLAAVTVMYKKEGYNPEAGDWFWLKYLPDGTIEKEGKAEGCINCHGTRKDNDYIFTSPIK